jgi:hypothetical protein
MKIAVFRFGMFSDVLQLPVYLVSFTEIRESKRNEISLQTVNEMSTLLGYVSSGEYFCPTGS